jgi:hypothetical protein
VNFAARSLEQAGVVVFRVGGDKRLSVAPQVAPTQQIQAHFTPQGAFVAQATRAAVSLAKPYFGIAFVGRAPADTKGGAANAGFSFSGGHNNLYRFHIHFQLCNTI